MSHTGHHLLSVEQKRPARINPRIFLLALGMFALGTDAYGYRHTERFLAELAKVEADEVLTEALASWTATLWKLQACVLDRPVPVFYIDGHRKAVYADHLIPRGLVGRLEKVLGCRALVVLHDHQGHPLLVTTHRGDQHLTIGLPAMIMRYERAAGLHSIERVVVDREGMAAEFLAALASKGRTVVTVLRTDQYSGLESFQEIGEFVPLRVDRQGKVIREVALARFSLLLPEHHGQKRDLRVALIRDLSRQIRCEDRPEDEDRPLRWDEKSDGTHEYWLDERWKATPLPATPTVPKLIPIVTTAPEADAVELAQTYTKRWPVQENAIRDWLIPLGIDINHGYAQTPVINADHGDVNPGFFTALEHLIVFGEPTPGGKPGEGTFDNPTMGKHMKTARSDLLPIHFDPFWDPDASQATDIGCSTISTSHPNSALTHSQRPSFLYPLSAQISLRRGKQPLRGASKGLPPRAS